MCLPNVNSLFVNCHWRSTIFFSQDLLITPLRIASVSNSQPAAYSWAIHHKCLIVAIWAVLTAQLGIGSASFQTFDDCNFKLCSADTHPRLNSIWVPWMLPNICLSMNCSPVLPFILWYWLEANQFENTLFWKWYKYWVN